jgi:hypothetical protein
VQLFTLAQPQLQVTPQGDITDVFTDTQYAFRQFLSNPTHVGNPTGNIAVTGYTITSKALTCQYVIAGYTTVDEETKRTGI